MNNALLTGKTEKHIKWLTPSCGIHHEILAPWQALCTAAKSEGFDLTIASGFRSFDRQLSIWNRKFCGKLSVKDKSNEVVNIFELNDNQRIKAILTYSALPGASRHHWGTDIDIYAPSLLADGKKLQLEPWEYQKNGPFAQLSRWLTTNAEHYGFYLPYDKFRGGIAAEPWHLSYFPIANDYQKKLTREMLNEELEQSEISGKAAILEQLDGIFTNYITNIGKIQNG